MLIASVDCGSEKSRRAGGGGALLASKLRTYNAGWHREYLFLSAAVVVFAVFLVVGVHVALWLNAREHHKTVTAHIDQSIDARQRWRDDIVKDVEFRKGIAEQCSKNQARTNAGRAGLGLPPLPSEVFCDIEQLSVPRESPDGLLGETPPE